MRQPPFLFPAGSRLHTDNLILHARARRHTVENYSGPLSIKTVGSGHVAWFVRGRDLVVDRTSFLVLPCGEPYSMAIDTDEPVETCCSFFADGFVEQLAGDVIRSPDEVLSNGPAKRLDVPYLTVIHSGGERLIQRVQSLRQSCVNSINPSRTEEAFLLLGLDLLQLFEAVRDQITRIPAARSATRQELHRRILIGRDYLHAHSSEAVSIASASRAACLSLFHFHRGFRQAFGETPHEYLTGLRMVKARDLLASGWSALETCLEVGFSSPSAFSRAFGSYFGYAPVSVRKKFARMGKNERGLSPKLRA